MSALTEPSSVSPSEEPECKEARASPRMPPALLYSSSYKQYNRGTLKIPIYTDRVLRNFDIK